MTPSPIQRRTLLKASFAGLPALAAVGCHSTGHHGDGDAGHAHADDSPAMQKAVTQGVSYFQKRCVDQLPLVQDLHQAIKAGNLSGAQKAYVESRPPYEEIETTALCFEDSDSDIDARPYAFDGGETDPAFRGFHKIEAFLFGYKELAAAEPFAAGLVKSVKQLSKDLGERGRFNATAQFDGMIGLANEVAAKKVSSEEETWSDQSLLIFRSNWIGIISQFKPFAPLLKGKPEAERVMGAYKAAMATVEPHAKPGTAALTPYSKIGMVERRKMADASNTLRDALTGAREALGV